jgi:hypothetical protein
LGRIIAPFGGQFRVTAEHPDVGRQDYLYADTREEMRKAIRENLHYGATWIKIVEVRDDELDRGDGRSWQV